VGGRTVGAGQQGCELVAAVAVEPVGFACGVGHRGRELDEQSVAGGVAKRVVEPLECVEIEHQYRERPACLDHRAELALERAVVAQAREGILLGPHADLAMGRRILHRDRRLAGEQLGELEFVRREIRIPAADASDIQRSDRVALDEQRDDDHRLWFERRPRHLDRSRIDVRLVRQHGLPVIDDPAGDARSKRALMGEDQVGEAVAGDDCTTDAGNTVDLVDRQRVIRHDRLERIGDQIEDPDRIERR
jgi:hypothetical protein